MAQVDVSLLQPDASGEGWSVNSVGNTLSINRDAKIELTGGEVGIQVNNGGTILGGIFNNIALNSNTISGGTFNSDVTNRSPEHSTISGGIFNGIVTNSNNSTISDGIFNGKVYNDNSSTISGGTFSGVINNDGTITNLIAKESLQISGNQAQKITLNENMSISNELYTASKK